MDRNAWFSRFCATLLMLTLVVIFVLKAAPFYTEKIYQSKMFLESHFATPPKEMFLKQLYFDYMRISNRRYINGVIVMNGERLVLEKIPNPPLLSARANAIVALKDYLDGKNTPFLFLRVPNQMKDITELPRGFENTLLEDGEQFLSILRENDVDIFDFREEMSNYNLDYATSFYHGDEHWTNETAFWAYGRLCTYMNEKYNFSIDSMTWDPQAHDFITYKKALWGYLARRVGSFRFREDYTYVVPKFDTAFEISNKISATNIGEGAGLTASGRFVDVFTPLVKFKNAESDYTADYSDCNVLSGVNRRYKNLTAKEDKKVLFVCDSYGTNFSTYLANGFEIVDYFYLVPEQNQELYNLLAVEKYDFVLFLAYDGNMLKEGEHWETDRLYLGNPVD